MKTKVDKTVRITVEMSEEELVIILASLGNHSDVSWEKLRADLVSSNSEIIPPLDTCTYNDVYRDLWHALQEVRG